MIIIAGLVLRIVLAPTWMKHNPFAANEPSHIAAHLVSGQGFSAPYEGTPVAPTAQQPPLYPLLLAAVFRVAGIYSSRSLAIIAALNCVLGSLMCFLILKAGSRWFSPLGGVLAAWLWALLPAIAATDLFLSNYLLSAAFILAWLLALPAKRENMSGQRSALLGLALGFGILLNSMLVVLYLGSLPWLRKKLYLSISAACMLAVISPWIIRNYVVLGHFYPGLRDNLGLELYLGNHPGVARKTGSCPWTLCNGTYEYDAAFPTDNPVFAKVGEASYMELVRRRATDYIISNPRQFIVSSAKRAAAFWLLPYPWLNLVIALLAWGAVARIGAPVRFFALAMLGLYPLAFYATQVAWPTSYRHPIQPIILLCAAESLTMLMRRAHGSRLRAHAASAAEW